MLAHALEPFLLLFAAIKAETWSLLTLQEVIEDVVEVGRLLSPQFSLRSI